MPGIELSLPINVEIKHVGDEQTPVVVIDELLLNTDSLIRQGCEQAKFEVDKNAGYPGVRAALPPEYTQAVLPELIPLLYKVYRIPTQFRHQVIFDLYSLLAQPPETLSLLQRIPHFDSNRDFYFASVNYLSPGAYAGTGIFRHRPTGFERISERRKSDYIRSAKEFMSKHGQPEPQYINSSNEHYELITEIEYKPNRLVLYPGNLLHSGMVEPARDINGDPKAGRLTANLFLDFDRPYRG